MYIFISIQRKSHRNRRIRRRTAGCTFFFLDDYVLSSQKRIIAPNFVMNFVSELHSSRARCLRALRYDIITTLCIMFTRRFTQAGTCEKFR